MLQIQGCGRNEQLAIKVWTTKTGLKLENMNSPTTKAIEAFLKEKNSNNFMSKFY